jgi:hypothetical protein
MLKKKANIIGLVLIGLMAIGILYLVISNRLNKVESGSNLKYLVPEQYEDSDSNYTVDFSIVQEGLNDMGFLVTQEYDFTQVESYTKEKKIVFFTSKASFTYSYDGVVEAGVDFTKISVSKDDDKKKIYIDIPDAEIHGITVDENSFKEYDEDNKFWNPIKLQDFNNAQKEFKSNAEKKAIQRGILDKADEQAKVIIGNFVDQLIGETDYTIEYR